MITLKYRRLSWYGVALIPGAAEAGERGRETKVPKRERRRSLRGGRRLVPSRSVARDSYDTMQRGRNYSQRARTRLTQKALGFLHDAPGEQAGVGHLGGRSAQQSTGKRVREAAHGAESAATAMAHRCLRGEQGFADNLESNRNADNVPSDTHTKSPRPTHYHLALVHKRSSPASIGSTY